MKNKIKFLAVLALLTVGFANAQVGVGTTTPDGSAVLDVSSTTKGLLLPRLDGTQRDAISLPATGLMIYNTSSNAVQFNSGTPASPIWTNAGGAVPDVTIGTIHSETIGANTDYSANNASVFKLSTSAGPGTLAVTLPDATMNKGRVVVIGNLGPKSITVTNSFTPSLAVISTRSMGFVSDGIVWISLAN